MSSVTCCRKKLGQACCYNRLARIMEEELGEESAAAA
jgi:hypothetical protein